MKPTNKRWYISQRATVWTRTEGIDCVWGLPSRFHLFTHQIGVRILLMCLIQKMKSWSSTVPIKTEHGWWYKTRVKMSLISLSNISFSWVIRGSSSGTTSPLLLCSCGDNYECCETSCEVVQRSPCSPRSTTNSVSRLEKRCKKREIGCH